MLYRKLALTSALLLPVIIATASNATSRFRENEDHLEARPSKQRKMQIEAAEQKTPQVKDLGIFRFDNLLSELQEVVLLRMHWLTARNFGMTSKGNLKLVAEKDPRTLPSTVQELLELIQRQPTMTQAFDVFYDRLQFGFWPFRDTTKKDRPIKEDRQIIDLPTFIRSIPPLLEAVSRDPENADYRFLFTLEDHQFLRFNSLRDALGHLRGPFALARLQPAILAIKQNMIQLLDQYAQHQDDYVKSKYELECEHKKQAPNQMTMSAISKRMMQHEQQSKAALRDIVALGDTDLVPEPKEGAQKAPEKTLRTLLQKYAPYFLLDCICTACRWPKIEELNDISYGFMSGHLDFIHLSDVLVQIDQAQYELKSSRFGNLTKRRLFEGTKTALRKAELAKDLIKFTFNRRDSQTLSDEEFARLYHRQSARRYYALEYRWEDLLFTSQEEFDAFQEALIPFITPIEKAYNPVLLDIRKLARKTDNTIALFQPGGSQRTAIEQSIRVSFDKAGTSIQGNNALLRRLIKKFDCDVKLFCTNMLNGFIPIASTELYPMIPIYTFKLSQLGLPGFFFHLQHVQDLVKKGFCHRNDEEVNAMIQNLTQLINHKASSKLGYYVMLLDLYLEKAKRNPTNSLQFMWEFIQTIAPGPLGNDEVSILNIALSSLTYPLVTHPLVQDETVNPRPFVQGETVNPRRIFKLLTELHFRNLSRVLGRYMHKTQLKAKDDSIRCVSIYIEKYEKMRELFHVDTNHPTIITKLERLKACLEMDNYRYPENGPKAKAKQPMSVVGIERICHCLISLCEDPKASILVYKYWEESLKNGTRVPLHGESPEVFAHRKIEYAVRIKKLKELIIKIPHMSTAEFLKMRATMMQEAASRIFPQEYLEAIQRDVEQDLAVARRLLKEEDDLLSLFESQGSQDDDPMDLVKPPEDAMDLDQD